MAPKFIAFYLPQYHEIPENSAWWGEGFTEWTNVKRGLPLFEGHYQPHVPKNSNYYRLNSTETPLNQIKLAKQYGIDGFCFYFYWFNSKTILEGPTKRWLENPQLDFPFCLCWANENWTRRWDGKDKEILLKQKHSPRDDRLFINYISRYLKDDRYIRIDGKPLVILYRPKLLPRARFTANQWRYECMMNGIGEIHLSYVQTLEISAPHDFGFDSAIEFPPHGIKTSNITASTRKLYPNDNCIYNVKDYKSLVSFSNDYPSVDYPLFRGVCPSWDNTARRMMKGACIFQHSSPELFQKWLLNASRWSEKHAIKLSSSHLELVFINAWNEWAEGCHLEPDQKYGMQWLEAVRDVKLELKKVSTARRKPKCVVVFHVFYLDVFGKLIPRIKNIAPLFSELHLLITTLPENHDAINLLLADQGVDYSIALNPNRGRDVLPFILSIPLIRRFNPDYILKMHTKKSLHRRNGDEWLEGIADDFLSEQGVSQCLDVFEVNPSVGLIAPRKNLIPLAQYMGGNAECLKKLLKNIDCDFNEFLSTNFVAGTMFMCKAQLLDSLEALQLEADDFEQEMGQLDGTMAHSIERLCSFLMQKMYSLRTVSIDYTVASDFPYAKKTIIHQAISSSENHKYG